MTTYVSYLEPYRNGGYITHTAYEFDTAYTLCGLPIDTLQTLEQVGEVKGMLACPRCTALVEAQEVSRMQAWQMALWFDWGGEDGR